MVNGEEFRVLTKTNPIKKKTPEMRVRNRQR